ncbi:MAG: SPOR domain-containing protein [Arsenophonus sp.]
MVQKDYVRRGRITTPRKNKYLEKKKTNQGVPKAIFAVAIVIVVIFISVLYYITKNKRVPILNKRTFLNNNHSVINLPPKPEERWRYIKELEKMGMGADLLNFNNSPKSNINNTSDLTNEQRYFLEQIDADRNNPDNNLSEVPNNNVPRSHVIINESSIDLPLLLKPVPQSQQARNIQQKIILHCSSFKNLQQAESLKANLAFSGLESRVRSIKGWHQVILGPYNQETAKKIQDRAKSVDLSGCILHATKG